MTRRLCSLCRENTDRDQRKQTTNIPTNTELNRPKCYYQCINSTSNNHPCTWLHQANMEVLETQRDELDFAVDVVRTTRTSSQRRSALSELPDVPNEPATPNKAPSPDEQVIIQRGIRRKPLTWSPYEGNRSRLFAAPREKTPERKTQQLKPDMNSKLRRRLIMSSESTEGLGEVIEKRLRSYRNARLATTVGEQKKVSQY